MRARLQRWLKTARDVLLQTQRAFGLVWGTSAWMAVVIVVLAVINGLLPAGIAWTGRVIVDGIVRAIDGGDPDARADVLRAVIFEGVLVALLAAASRTARLVESLLRALVGQRVNEQILEKVLTLSLADFEDADFYDRLNRARREASSRPLGMVLSVLELVQSLITLVAFGGLMLQLSGWTLLLLVIAAVPQFIVQTRFSSDAFRLFRWKSPETRKQAYLETVLSREDHAKEVKLYGLGPLFLDRYRAIFVALFGADRALTIRRSFWGWALGVLSTAAFYAAYAWAALEAVAGAITLGEMTMVLVVFRQAQDTLQMLLGTVSELYDDSLYLGTLYEILDHQPSVRNTGTARVGPDPSDGVRFEDVTFGYPGAPKPVLDGITLHLPPKHKLALVGSNGAGKTTLIKLLTRLYVPTSGRITLDGLDLLEWDEAALHQRIGVIFQDFVRYQLTVGENVGAGDVDALLDEARWKTASDKGMATEVVETLPKGFQTQLGKWFDDGRELSLGQWQKIALSRAFMRERADILVLDEPTASMDAEAEAKVFERFRALSEDRTVVLISHRFSTVRMADTIAVLDGGRIAEQGTHESLVRHGGLYARLFSLQASGYR